jgi:hypothetical protein
VRVGDHQTMGYAQAVAVAGNYAYVADGPDVLQVIDVRNPTSCVRVRYCNTGGWAYGVAVAGDYVYVASGCTGLQAIDISTQPSGHYPHSINWLE